MAYTLNFSDPTKVTAVIVPDMPPGINTVDTSLSFVGKGYPNYGQVMDQNLLKLLENFASPIPPNNPVEGQLWFDTSNPNNKVLRIMDGTASAVNWPSATGIYRQPTDPTINIANIGPGDIWINTAINQMNIYSANAWVAVNNGNGSNLNGAVNETLTDTTGGTHYVTLNYVDGTVVSIIALESFTPNPVIPGFSSLFPGVNIFNTGIFTGSSIAALNLVVNKNLYAAGTFLRKDDTSASGQVITGRISFSTPNTNNSQAGAQGRDGVVINVVGQPSTNYTQLYKYGSNSILLNNQAGGNIILQTVGGSSTLPNNTMSVSDGVVAINTATGSISLDVYGTARISGDFTIGGTTSIAGNTSVSGNLNVGGVSVFGDDATVNGQIFVNWLDGSGNPRSGSGILPSVSNIYDIGSSTQKFKQIWASTIGGPGTQLQGVLNGPANYLANASTFQMTGQITAPSFNFNGTGTSATFVTSLSPTAITSQPNASYTTASMTLLVVDTSTSASYSGLQQITRDGLMAGILPPGIIMANASIIPPAGWLLCDGSTYQVQEYPALAQALQYFDSGNFVYGGDVVTGFKVPNLSTATSVIKTAGTEPTNFVNYIIKT